VAASLFLGVAVSSFWFFLSEDRPGGSFAGRQRSADSVSEQWNDILPPEQAPLPSTPMPPDPNSDRVVRDDTSPETPGLPEVIPPPRVIDRPVYGYPSVPPLPPLDLINVRIPFLVSVAELDREDVRQRLSDELARDPAYRIDLFVKDAPRGVELFQKVAAANGLTLFADAGGLDRVKKRLVTSVVVYSESLTPAEARDLLAKAAEEDGRVKGPSRVLDTLHVAPLLPPDHRDHNREFARDLRDLFGGDLGLGKKPVPSAAPPAGNSKPLSAGTGDEVVKTLTNKLGERTAVLLAYGPPQLRTAPAMSAELKQYLSRRGERRSNSVPIVIVIRTTSGG
jgi:hypothetical protein